MTRCEVAHSKGYTSPPEAAYDLGRHIAVTGIPGKVRFLCEDCAQGRISSRFQERFRINKPKA